MHLRPAWSVISPKGRVAIFGKGELFLFVEAYFQPPWGLWHFQVTDFFEAETCYASGSARKPEEMERLVEEQIVLLYTSGFKNRPKTDRKRMTIASCMRKNRMDSAVLEASLDLFGSNEESCDRQMGT